MPRTQIISSVGCQQQGAWLYPGDITTVGFAPPETLAAQRRPCVTRKPDCRQSSHFVRRWHGCLGCAFMQSPTPCNWVMHYRQRPHTIRLSLVLLTLRVDGAQSKLCVLVKCHLGRAVHPWAKDRQPLGIQPPEFSPPVWNS